MFKNRINLISSLIVLACLLISISMFASAYASIEQVTNSAKEKTSEVMSPSPTPSLTQKTLTPATTSLPYAAEIVSIPSWRNSEQTGVLFSNNTGNFLKLSCTVRQHAPDGTYLSEVKVTSDFIPPKSHFVSVLSLEAITGLTINDLRMESVPSQSMLHFILVTVNNITMTTTDVSGNLAVPKFSNGKAIPTLNGKLLNTGTETFGETGTGQEGFFTPTIIRIQILKRTANGGLTLVGDVDTQHYHENASISPIPPPNENGKFSIALWDNITITDSAKAIIDGEINVVAQKLP